MLVFTVSIILVIALLLVLVVLAQDSKGGGLTGNIGSASQIMGTRRTTNWIEKATWTLAVILFVLCLGVNTFIDRAPVAAEEGINSPNIERATEDGTGGGIVPENLDVPIPEENSSSEPLTDPLPEPSEDEDSE